MGVACDRDGNTLRAAIFTSLPISEPSIPTSRTRRRRGYPAWRRARILFPGVTGMPPAPLRNSMPAISRLPGYSWGSSISRFLLHSAYRHLLLRSLSEVRHGSDSRGFSRGAGKFKQLKREKQNASRPRIWPVRENKSVRKPPYSLMRSNGTIPQSFEPLARMESVSEYDGYAWLDPARFDYAALARSVREGAGRARMLNFISLFEVYVAMRDSARISRLHLRCHDSPSRLDFREFPGTIRRFQSTCLCTR